MAIIGKDERATKGLVWPPPVSTKRLPDEVPPIRLRHGQALWLLTELGYRGTVSRGTFYEYIKSLRKLGIPFGRVKFQTERGRRLADYSYFRMMELAVALSLRVYHVVPDSVLRGIIRYRSDLDRFYRRAYEERHSGAGQPIVIAADRNKPIALRGLFLDLNIKFSGGRLIRFGPPRLLSAIEALKQFSDSIALTRPFTPISLSILSEQIISLALRAPEIRSGPRGGSIRGIRHKHDRRTFRRP
jgi:AcrR family transcriptional regulator